TLVSPENGFASDSSIVTFRWNSANDAINGSEVSGIKCYQLQVDDDQDFSSPVVNENTSNNATFSLTKTVTGKLYWRVRAIDNAENAGEFSEIRNLTVFNFSLNANVESLQILRGTNGSITLSISRIFGDNENITLSYEWIGFEPNGITIYFTTMDNITDFSSTISFQTTGEADTGDFICRINATSYSGIKKILDVNVGIIGMSYLILANPSSISLIRSDSDKSTVSVIFMIGAKDSVTLNGGWQGITPQGINVNIYPSNGIPSYDSSITFETGNDANAGEFIYRITSSGGGLTQWADIYVEVKTTLNVTVATDKQTYEKGENIHISGTVKDPKGDMVSSGTLTINFSCGDWSRVITTSVSNGFYSTSYYITFDKPDGVWNISVSAVDTRGHVSLSSVNVSVSVFSPNVFQYYIVNVLNPVPGQVFRRGEIVSFSVSLVNVDGERVHSADVKAFFDSGDSVVFSEGSPGVYSGSFELGYDFVLGESRVYVEGKKFEDGKIMVGFSFFDFRVSSVSLVVKLVNVDPGGLVEVGELVTVKLQVLYPSGVPVDDVVLNGSGPGGTELFFSKCGSEAGVYSTSFVPSEDDVGDWVVVVNASDVFGNFYTGNFMNIEVVHVR
ncbi:MAG: hypothetical protein QHH15_07490, partial [Candidatus Thermoplasmatota archaeon]|nr:hypothetical protein [Candidatus Thermoplasmatota archaeon]